MYTMESLGWYMQRFCANNFVQAVIADGFRRARYFSNIHSSSKWLLSIFNWVFTSSGVSCASQNHAEIKQQCSCSVRIFRSKNAIEAFYNFFKFSFCVQHLPP